MDFALAAQIGGFIIMGALLIMVESQNRSLQRQVTEQREVGHADRISLAQKDQIIALQSQEIASMQTIAGMATDNAHLVEDMNRILIDQYRKRTQAQTKRRATLAAKKEDA